MKIIWPEVSYPNHFAIDHVGFYLNKTCFFSPIDSLSILGILNSKLVLFFLLQICNMMRGGYLLKSKIYVEQIPIIKPSKDIDLKLGRLAKKVLDKKETGKGADTLDLEAEIDQLVYELYGLTEEEIRLIETGS